jgi:hypothetical protein
MSNNFPLRIFKAAIGFTENAIFFMERFWRACPYIYFLWKGFGGHVRIFIFYLKKEGTEDPNINLHKPLFFGS